MSPDNENKTTRDRLLKVAETLFAQRGYHAVSVREITTAANCNLAAVNYHFGNKKNLYLDVFRLRWMVRARRVHDSFTQHLAKHDGASPTEIIQALAEAFIKGPLADDERFYHAQLMMREMAKPTEAFEMVADEILRPFFRNLAKLLQPYLPEEIDEQRVNLNMLSIISMVIYFNFARVPVSLFTGCTYDEAFKERLIQHIVNFALTGLNVREKEKSL
ncbi:MAG: CerR family C-terminal domain-containing protein [Deltaproteobacteria bacterium]|nr:CerR family C-terminal domain-containing protein [Deltaproteobacteria bacterium]